MNPLKFVKTNLRSFWKKATSDPLYAAKALGLGASLYGAAGSTFFPEDFKEQMNFLDMGPTTELGPVTSQRYQTGLGFNNAGQSFKHLYKYCKNFLLENIKPDVACIGSIITAARSFLYL